MSDFFSLILALIDRHWEVLYGLLVAVGLFVYVTASQALMQRRHPSAAIAWVLGIVLLPYITLPLYLAFGSRKVKPSPLSEEWRKNAKLPQGAQEVHGAAARAQQLGRAMGLPAPVAYTELTIHENGLQALEALRRTIEGAKQTLEISTFLFGRDVLGDEIADLLKQKALAGVKVRLMIDGIGIYLGGYPELKGLSEVGVEVTRFVPPFKSPKHGRTNLRNHRKMVIADGVHLWCGGRNLAAEYFIGDPRPILGRKPWLDLSFDLKGKLAAHALAQFEEDLAFATERRSLAVWTPEASVSDDVSLAQLVASGPDQPDDTIQTLLICGCFTAQRRILAVTPYFVPDNALLKALSLAARRGIDVDLVLPEKSNHQLADFARHRSLRDLVAAGGRVWLHPRMIHAKAVILDDELALVGSANLDGRSLFLNYEVMVAFYDPKAVSGFSQWVDVRRQESKSYFVHKPSFLRELAEGLLLWLAFQL